MTNKTSRKARAVFNRIGVVSVTGLTIAGAIALAVLGTDIIAARAERPPATAEIVPLPVQAGPLVRQEGYRVDARYQGRIEARQSVSLAFELGGTVRRVVAQEGQAVETGDVLAELDTRALRADRAAQVAARDALETQLQLARLTEDRQKALLEREFASTQRYDEARLTVAQLEAELRRAEAAINAVDVALEKSLIRAPFAATVGARFLDDGATAAPGQAVFMLFERMRPEFHVGLPEDMADRLDPGTPAVVEIGGQTFAAAVTRVRPDIDLATRTVPVVLTLEDQVAIPEGTLGTLTLTREVAGEGAWIPASALTEGLRGLWTIYLLEDSENGQIARREAVELIYAEEDRAFVGGAFSDEGRVVLEGTHRLSDGQPVLDARSGS